MQGCTRSMGWRRGVRSHASAARGQFFLLVGRAELIP